MTGTSDLDRFTGGGIAGRQDRLPGPLRGRGGRWSGRAPFQQLLQAELGIEPSPRLAGMLPQPRRASDPFP